MARTRRSIALTTLISAAGLFLASCGAATATVGTTLHGLTPVGATMTPNGGFVASGTNYSNSVQWFNVHTGKLRTTNVGFRVWWAAAPTDTPLVVAAGETSVAEVDAATETVLRRVHVGGVVGQPISLSHGLVLVPFGTTSGLLVKTSSNSMSVVSLPCPVTASAAKFLPRGLVGIRPIDGTQFAISCGIGKRIQVIEAEILDGRVVLLHRMTIDLPSAAIPMAAAAMAFSPENNALYVATTAVPSEIQSFVNTNDAGVTIALSTRTLHVIGAHWSGSNSIAVTPNGHFVIEANASGVALQVLNTQTFGAIGSAERCATPWQRATALEGTSMPTVQASCASGIACYAVPYAAEQLGVDFFQWAGDGRFVVVTYADVSKVDPIWIDEVMNIQKLQRSHTDLNDTGCQG